MGFQTRKGYLYEKKTLAMLLAENGQMIPKYCRHDPVLMNRASETVALIYAKKQIIPPKEWMYDVNKHTQRSCSIANYLRRFYLPIPHHWKDREMTIFDKACYGEIPKLGKHKPDETNEDGQTIAMILAQLKIQISKEWYHKPEIQDQWGCTVAMYLAFLKQEIPKEWEHDPLIKDSSNNTVAMYLASTGVIPQKQWQHKPQLYNKNGQTVGLFLAKRRILPPKEWMHNVQWIDSSGYTLLNTLLHQNYIYKNKQFIPDCKTQKINDTCQVCLQQGEQDFVVSKCSHKICVNCFIQLNQQDQVKKCLICKLDNWYEKIQEKEKEKVSDSQDSTPRIKRDYIRHQDTKNESSGSNCDPDYFQYQVKDNQDLDYYNPYLNQYGSEDEYFYDFTNNSDYSDDGDSEDYTTTESTTEQ